MYLRLFLKKSLCSGHDLDAQTQSMVKQVAPFLFPLNQSDAHVEHIRPQVGRKFNGCSSGVGSLLLRKCGFQGLTKYQGIGGNPSSVISAPPWLPSHLLFSPRSPACPFLPRFYCFLAHAAGAECRSRRS